MKNQIGCLKDEINWINVMKGQCRKMEKKYAKNENESIYSSMNCTIQKIYVFMLLPIVLKTAQAKISISSVLFRFKKNFATKGK